MPAFALKIELGLIRCDLLRFGPGRLDEPETMWEAWACSIYGPQMKPSQELIDIKRSRVSELPGFFILYRQRFMIGKPSITLMHAPFSSSTLYETHNHYLDTPEGRELASEELHDAWTGLEPWNPQWPKLPPEKLDRKKERLDGYLEACRADD